MKILLSTFGTRGDIQPFIALGKGLKAAGHAVAMCTPEGFRASVETHGLRYEPMDNSFFDLIQTEAGRAAFESFGKALALIRQVAPSLRRIMRDEWQAAQAFQPDVIVYHPKTLGSYHIAEKLQIPAFLTLPLPFYTPTRAFPNPFFARLRLGGRLNRFTYQLMARASAPYAGMINTFRVNTLGLPPRGRFASTTIAANGAPVPILYPYSQHVVPVPADYPPHAHVTGYWFLDGSDDWQPQPELARFLDSGPPPVYVGFGSMSGNKAAQRTRTVIDALTRAAQRGILASGWGGLAASHVPEHVLVIDEAPHDWLFPRVAAVVHHGGAGTTAAGLRAGKPTLICPFIADQPFWGMVVHARGAGPQPIPQRRLTAPRLAAAIATMVQDRDMQRRAAALGEQIRGEDGVAEGIAILCAAVGSTATQASPALV